MDVGVLLLGPAFEPVGVGLSLIIDGENSGADNGVVAWSEEGKLAEGEVDLSRILDDDV